MALLLFELPLHILENPGKFIFIHSKIEGKREVIMINSTK